MKQSLSNIAKYREEDKKKIEEVKHEMEENKKQNGNKLAALENFILTLKETTEKAATQAKPQSQVEASLNLMEDVRSLVSRSDNLTYKFDALSYDLNLIKSDIIRQQRSQQGYFEKVDKLEKRLDNIPLGTSMHLGSKNLVNTSNANFMANQSTRTIDDHNFNRILAADGHHSKQSGSTEEPTRQSEGYQKPQYGGKNFFMDDEQFAANLSIIDKGAGRRFLWSDQSEMMDEDIFMNAHGGKGTAVGTTGTAPINFERKTEFRYMESIPEEDFEQDKSKTRPSHGAARTGPPAPQPIGARGHQGGGIMTSSLIKDVGMIPPQQTSNFQPPDSPPKPEKVTSGPTSKTTSNFGRLASLGDGNTSMLNQSLNSSVRIHKSVLQKMDISIAEGAGKNADESSVIELNIDENGFLIDENGYPILNDKGEPMKLTDDNIDFLKENGLYEEEELLADDYN